MKKHKWILKEGSGIYECSECLTIYTVSGLDSKLPEEGCTDNPFAYTPGAGSPPIKHRVLGECVWCGADAHTKSYKTGKPLCFPCAYHEAH